MRVSRLFNLITAPILYRIVILHPERGTSFIRALQNPYLYQHVYALTVHDHHTIDTLYAESLARIIPHLHNLRHLILKGCYTQCTLVNDNMLRRTNSLYVPVFQSPFLTNLRSCTLSLSYFESWPMATRECIFAHPTLQSLCIINATMSSFHSFTDSMRHSTALESLSLLCCDLSAATLRKILSVPRALRQLVMMGSRQFGLPEYTSARHDLYIEAMLPQAHSLTVLHLGFGTFSYNFASRVSFRRFVALQDLAITPCVVPTPDGFRNLTPFEGNPFPASLRSLFVMHANPIAVAVVEEMFALVLRRVFWMGLLPHLRDVTFGTTVFCRDQYMRPWTEMFLGRVAFRRVVTTLLMKYPIACDCSDYNLAKGVFLR
ncbi:hypothetical protein BDW62DRAFT_212525 [Aspergillus aurantiobrunneus]